MRRTIAHHSKKTDVETHIYLDDELAGAIFRATVKVARAIRAASRCAGMNIVQSNGKLVNRMCFHFHLHLVPRFPDDDIQLGWDNTPEDRSRLDSLAEEIRAKMVVG